MNFNAIKLLSMHLIGIFSVCAFANLNQGVKKVGVQHFWYKGSCTSASVELIDFTGKNKVRKLIQVTDPSVIKKITDLLDKLPTSGDLMVSMGPTAVTKLTLHCDESKFEIQFFGNRIKTPQTSFFSGEKPEETALFNLLKNLT